MVRLGRLAAIGFVAALAAASCGADDLSPAADTATSSDGGPGLVAYGDSTAVVVDTDQVPSTVREDGLPSGLNSYTNPTADLPPPTIDLAVLRSGGPPPDGIPSIDDPSFHRASTVDYLAPDDPVIAVEIDGDARAYPLDVMIWHELVNDTVGGVPVSVAYCPLCNSVTVYEREIGDRVVEFGVSGLLYNSSLVMFDRQTETLWSHFTGEPLYGAMAGTELVSLPSTIVGFEEWQRDHPDGLVLNRDTGATREYGLNPYPGYDDVNSEPFLFEGEVDGRFTAMTRFVGVETRAGAVGFPLLELRDAGVVSTEVDGDQLVAFWTPGATSALDGATVSGGVDVGATGVFSPLVDGDALTFAAEVDDDEVTIIDDQTGSTWNVFGEAIEGELSGTQLEQFVHIDTFWFAWIAFHPDSAIAS